MTKANLAILASFLLLILGAAVAIVFARGYQVDFTKKELAATGILVATSDPDGAEVFVNNKLTTATNSTINLKPGIYQIKIAKDGYVPWQKTVTIKKEEVFKTNVFLFPQASDLKPLTLNGAQNPVLSPDLSQIVYSVASASANANGVWILDMAGGRPLIGGGDLRQILRNTTYLNISNINKYLWSGDSKQILASTSGNLYYPLDSNRLNDNPIATAQVSQLLKPLPSPALAKISPGLLLVLASSAASFRFSPDETKVLYAATASASLPAILTAYLPGANPTPETRKLSPGNTYVYDLKEDRNYLIENCKLKIENCTWFSTSRHLILNELTQISVVDYDGTNKAIVYSGPFIDNFVFPWPNSPRVVILTSLNSNSPIPNLYSLNLR